jgi:sterol 3beta-glucosyltransferase
VHYSILTVSGDVQPYLSLGLRLVEKYNHTVRLATHPDFKDFVLDVNKRLKGKKGKDGRDLEGSIQFYDVGGDPKQLMAYMVKSELSFNLTVMPSNVDTDPGLLPGWASLTNGDIAAKRLMTNDMLQGFWQSTFSPDSVSQKPFAADAIISNPPAFAHVHIAEALGLPLLMSFSKLHLCQLIR